MIIVCFTTARASGPSADKIRKDCIASIHHFDYDNVKRLAMQMIELSRSTSDKNLEAEGKFSLAVAELFNGDPDIAKKHLDEAKLLSEQLGNDTLIAKILNSLGVYEASKNNNLYLAQTYFLRCAKIAEDHGMNSLLRSASNNIAQISIELNDTSGIKYAQEKYRFGVRTGDQYSQYSGAANLAELYIIKKDYGMARRFALIADSISKKNGFRVRGQVSLLRARVELAEGNMAEALEHARRAITLLDGSQRMFLPGAYLTLGEIYFAMGDLKEAHTALDEALRLTEDASYHGDRAEILNILSRVCDAQGDKEGALRYL